MQSNVKPSPPNPQHTLLKLSFHLSQGNAMAFNQIPTPSSHAYSLHPLTAVHLFPLSVQCVCEVLSS